MMKVTDHGTKIDNKSIIDFEAKLSYKLPQPYVQFMLQCNGGKCTPNYFEFIENNIKSASVVRAFWAFGGINGFYDLDKGYFTYKIEQGDRMPSAYVPIAEDDGGNLICISCDQLNYGQIFFWNHEEEDPADLFCNLSLVANSFTEFLNSLKKI